MKGENWDKDWDCRLTQILNTGQVPLKIIDYLRHRHPNDNYCWFPARAIIEKINTIDGMDIDKWIVLMRLINSTRFYREDIRGELFIRFKAYVPDATEARAIVMRTLLNLGHRFYPVDLESEHDIKNELPELWAYAWKQSGIWEQYQRQYLTGGAP